MKPIETVQKYWDDVWNAHNPDAVDDFVVDDVVIAIGGREISGREDLKRHMREILDKVNDLHVDAVETFQNEDGTRVSSRWVLTGSNNGVLGTEANGQPIGMTGVAIWAVGEDGKLRQGWVEQASWEQYRQLLAD